MILPVSHHVSNRLLPCFIVIIDVNIVVHQKYIHLFVLSTEKWHGGVNCFVYRVIATFPANVSHRGNHCCTSSISRKLRISIFHGLKEKQVVVVYIQKTHAIIFSLRCWYNHIRYILSGSSSRVSNHGQLLIEPTRRRRGDLFPRFFFSIYTWARAHGSAYN